MTDFNRLEWSITYDHSLLGPQISIEASWFDETGEEHSDYLSANADDANDAARIMVGWLEQNCGVTAPGSDAMHAALTALAAAGAAARLAS